MIYTPRTWYGRGQLSYRGANEGIVEAGYDELIQHSRWTTIQKTDAQRATESDPGVVDIECKPRMVSFIQVY